MRPDPRPTRPLDKKLPGPDHAFALEPIELERMVAAIREMERALGSAEKIVDPAEEELRHFARRSVFTTLEIQAGQAFEPGNTAILRRGKHPAGIEPKDYSALLHRKARRRIGAGEVVHWEDVAE